MSMQSRTARRFAHAAEAGSSLSVRRRGTALFMVMVFLGAIGAMAVSSIYLTGNANLISASFDKEGNLRYAAEAGLAIGKARVNYDAGALPDTGYITLLSNYQLKGADNQPLAGVHVNVYAGPSGSTSGQFGRFSSIVAEARDDQGTGFVRRLELVQESFAKFAYWSNSESNNGSPILFGGNDQLWGPVWSNDMISISNTGVHFHSDVGTASTITGSAFGTFDKGYSINQKPIALPANTMLASLPGYAAVAGFSYTPPTAGDATTVRMGLEFVALDMNGDGDSTDVNEGFFRVYQANVGQVAWLRADWPGSGAALASVVNCGDWHAMGPTGALKFFPVSVHNTLWFRNLLNKSAATGGGGLSLAAANTEKAANLSTIMQHANARCYLGGDPHLVAVARTAALYTDTLTRYKGGDDTTFTPVDAYGAWVQYSATPYAPLAALRVDARYLAPIYRGINTNSKGVIYANGTIGVSGTLRGRVTLFATGNVVLLDDLRYSVDPGLGLCTDILGIITNSNMYVADNAINSPEDVTGGGVWRSLDDTKDVYLHAVVMATGTSFQVENYSTGATNANGCEGTVNGRGCLYLTGGLIQQSRGAVGVSDGHGFTKRYSYDRCAVVNPPPYFPTTGRFNDNRYYELDPVNFNVANLFRAITPAQ